MRKLFLKAKGLVALTICLLLLAAAPAGLTPYGGQAPAPVVICSRSVLRSSTDLSGSGRGRT